MDCVASRRKKKKTETMRQNKNESRSTIVPGVGVRLVSPRCRMPRARCRSVWLTFDDAHGCLAPPRCLSALVPRPSLSLLSVPLDQRSPLQWLSVVFFATSFKTTSIQKKTFPYGNLSFPTHFVIHVILPGLPGLLHWITNDSHKMRRDFWKSLEPPKRKKRQQRSVHHAQN